MLAVAAVVRQLLPMVKGKIGESRVRRELDRGLPQLGYKVLHDITLPAEVGTTQIDHLVLSSFGLFVIETKTMSGWIFGSEHQATWTQSFHRKKVSFQNPLRQNYGHVKVLQQLLGLEMQAIFPVVVFAGDAVIKTPMPDNVLTPQGLPSYILSKTKECIAPARLPVLTDAIESHRLTPGRATDAEHVQALRRRHGPGEGLLSQVIGATQDVRSVFRMLKVGVALVFLLIVFWLITNIAGQFLPAKQTATAVTQPAVRAASGIQHQPAPRPVFGILPNTQSVLDRPQADQLRREQQQAVDKRLLWEASLLCAYSTDTGRCACYEPKGPKAVVDHEQCVALADQGAATAR